MRLLPSSLSSESVSFSEHQINPPGRYWSIIYAALPQRKRRRARKSQVVEADEGNYMHASERLDPDEKFPLSHEMAAFEGAIKPGSSKAHMGSLATPSGKLVVEKDDRDESNHGSLRGKKKEDREGSMRRKEKEKQSGHSPQSGLHSPLAVEDFKFGDGNWAPYPTHVISYRSEVVARVIDVPKLLDVAAEAQKVNEERILLFFPHTHPLRRLFIGIGKLAILDAIVFGAILVSCIFLLIAPPYEDYPSTMPCPWPQYVDPEKPNFCRPLLYASQIEVANTVFFVIFLVEFVIRVMSQGLFFTRDGYLRSGWNIVDFIVLCLSLVEETGALPGGAVGRVVRMGRALRPLRLMKRNQGMRIIIDALIGTLRPVLYVILFVVMTFFVFSLMGMGMFGRKMNKCNDVIGVVYPQGIVECSGTFTTSWGGLYPRSWDKPTHNFDDIWDAMLTLVRVNTVAYVGIINDVMDITEVNKQPSTNSSEIYSLFFVVYLVLGYVLAMNLFIGFIIDGFNANRGATGRAPYAVASCFSPMFTFS